MARPKGVIFQPDAYLRMQKGIHQMVTPIAATLGPLASNVVFGAGLDSDQPEVLDNGGLIARRIIELRDPDADMGAMIVRHLVTRIHRTVGDSTATAAVLFQAIYDEGVKYLAAGGNPTLLRKYLEAGANSISETLSGMVRQLHGKQQLRQFAGSICHDAPLAEVLGEIFEIIGADGQLDIHINNRRDIVREYHEGAFWDGGALSRDILSSHPNQRIVLRNPAVLICDLVIENPLSLEPLLTVAKSAGYKSVLLLALKVSDAALGLLAANNNDDFFAVAAKIPGGDLKRYESLEDVRAVVGGRILLKVAGDQLETVQLGDFGRARRAWVDRSLFGIIGGGGDSRTFRQYIHSLRQAFNQADDPDARKELQKRIGRLCGGSVTLRLGGATETEARLRQSLAKRTAEVVRTAIRGGVLPGGGSALLYCQPMLQTASKSASSADERAAYNMLQMAMEAPARTIICNAGFDASTILASIKADGNGCGYDVVRGQHVNLADAGIYDAADALQAAVNGAIHSAAQALTVSALVHRKNPEQVLVPG